MVSHKRTRDRESGWHRGKIIFVPDRFISLSGIFYVIKEG